MLAETQRCLGRMAGAVLSAADASTEVADVLAAMLARSADNAVAKRLAIGLTRVGVCAGGGRDRAALAAWGHAASSAPATCCPVLRDALAGGDCEVRAHWRALSNC